MLKLGESLVCPEVISLDLKSWFRCIYGYTGNTILEEVSLLWTSILSSVADIILKSDRVTKVIMPEALRLAGYRKKMWAGITAEG